MSGDGLTLGALLGGEGHGVFHLGQDVRDVEQRASRAGWDVVTLDTETVVDKPGFMDAAAEAFDLPEWFGRNWDALDECLRALDLDDPDGLLVVWDRWAPFAESDPDAFETAVAVFQDACVAWADDEVGGAVLLRGSGPETDLATIASAE
jgi:RNAse (barnase) inhibitor barstar